MNGCINACSLQSCENGGHCINKFEHALCDCKGTGYEGFACQIGNTLSSYMRWEDMTENIPISSL